MEQEKKENIYILKKLIEKENFRKLKNYSLDNLLDFFNILDDKKVKHFFSKLPLKYKRDIINHSNIHLTTEIINILEEKTDNKIYRIIKKLDLDDIADILLEFNEDKRKNILEFFSRKKKSNLKNLLTYPEDTAGGRMTKDYFITNSAKSVGEVKEILKNTENIHSLLYIYVVDTNKNLEGVLSLHDLLLAKDSDIISDIMTENVISVDAYADQEEVANLIEKYDFFALPVINSHNKLIGMITSDDIIDVIREEELEDVYKAVGIEEEDIYTKNIFSVAKMRLPWLVTTFFGSMFSAFLLSIFKATLQEIVILTSFIPVITAMGGNIGTQTATIIVKGMALGFINFEKLKKTLLRELSVAFIMSIVVAAIISSIAVIWHGKYVLGIILGISMILGITASSFVGTVTPFLMKKFKIDPAIATGPFVTTANDAMGIVIYLSLATVFINSLG
ncbi:MAG: magnesium transporter [Candidatus Mcinerneyibacterium aminivorans]|uniref:Magnesium transporter MgtE n=1 Tax=Candidatus Mcinerneyibacterium aminivorans TaxID=2703815 RepID=A0A5D0MCH3_9BACT|nr:MAG: magnesium transporter [Candidatus Mcinerneyibacterium aminivorans]